MENKMLTHGAFSWCELLTSELAGAQDFYRKLFNWEMETAMPPNTHYSLVKVGGEQIGGMMTIPPQCKDMRPAWAIYVTVDDVDATAKLAAQSGGTIVSPPQDIPEVGRFAVLQDPQGATMNIITYGPKAK